MKKQERKLKQEKKLKEIEIPLKFNLGTMKYEPVLPVKKTGEKIPIKLKIK